MERCFNVRTFFSALFTHSEVFLLLECIRSALLYCFKTVGFTRCTKYRSEICMASLVLLAVLTMYCIWSLRRIIKHAKKIAENVPVALIKALECADKGYFFPSNRTFYPNGRMCFQSVDEASSTKYDEDTIKQRFNCSDNRRKLREQFPK